MINLLLSNENRGTMILELHTGRGSVDQIIEKTKQTGEGENKTQTAKPHRKWRWEPIDYFGYLTQTFMLCCVRKCYFLKSVCL